MIPVDVNATFNTIGEIKPVYIRLEDEAHQLHTYRIVEIEYAREDKRAGILTVVYSCYIEEENLRKPLKIAYHVSTHRWVLLSYGGSIL
ncbi:MAG: hypothetical protein PWP24_861 [Clostridiales bacterium]|nr:hypothetical protein [Clostridiales bacterium]